MPGDLTIGVVVGVTPDRWVRVWAQRMPGTPLRVVAVPDAVAALADGADMVFARLPLVGLDADRTHTIPLWEEVQVVVAAKDHPLKAFDDVTLADLTGEEEHPGWADGVLDVVAAGHGIARMPQSVFRATGRRDLVARPVTDAEPTRVALVWPRTSAGPLIDEFVGIVRGRTANSSRGALEAPAPAPPPAPPPASRRAPAQHGSRTGRPQRSAKRRGTH